MDTKERSEIISYILKGNEMMRRHAEERHLLLKQIIGIINQLEDDQSTLVNQAIIEASNIQEEIELLENNLIDESETQTHLQFRLRQLNKMMKILDQKDERRTTLINEVMQADANLLSRDELIEILQEYLDMETASAHGLVAELSEAQTQIEEYNNQLNTYEKLSKHDPRFKGLEILNQHPEGMSMTQLSFMLGTSQYEAHKIIQELVEFGMIERKHDGELIHAQQQIDTGLTISELTQNVMNR
ncbi:MAG: hypothetical protein ACW98K_00725 [Candidatus Kariarchaeaceae archaeon]